MTELPNADLAILVVAAKYCLPNETNYRNQPTQRMPVKPYQIGSTGILSFHLA